MKSIVFYPKPIIRCGINMLSFDNPTIYVINTDIGYLVEI